MAESQTHRRVLTTHLPLDVLIVAGTVSEWEEWTGMRFPESGPYVVPGALQPVSMDLERDEGRYEDPNVWMRHPVSGDAPA